MNMKRCFKLTVRLLVFALVVGLGSAVSQQAPPTESNRMKAPVVALLDLGHIWASIKGNGRLCIFPKSAKGSHSQALH